MNVQRISLLAAALTLAAAPSALAMGPPQGSHGEETDAGTPPTLTAPSALPHGSHGQETDARTEPTFPGATVQVRTRATTTITTVARGLGLRTVDSDHSGTASLGDLQVERRLFVAARGAKLGRSSGLCVQINASGTLHRCESFDHFAGGDIVTSGSVSSSARTYTSTIVGGTGVYAGMSGIVRGRWLDSGFERALLVFSLWRS
jgi:hypothetical protein